MTSVPKTIAIVTGSTRTPRIGPQVVALIGKIFSSTEVPVKPSLTVLDIADYKLPVFDEETLPANVPAKGEFKHEHSKKWSAAVG